ncbi:hypothetical protein PR048_009505 [Dryococelus australis]|uniref:Uncharacterized protein n=1 Tax=Dryococelus australis TaxID=614101 RepID=A0ABQ9I027_9NEOP|nr:hypothetical protein PR048_009505 [Dryococelus australis]
MNPTTERCYRILSTRLRFYNRNCKKSSNLVYNGAAAVMWWLDYSPPTKVNQVRFPTGSLPDIRTWESSQGLPRHKLMSKPRKLLISTTLRFPPSCSCFPRLRPRCAGAVRATLSRASSALSPLSARLRTGVQCSCRTASTYTCVLRAPPPPPIVQLHRFLTLDAEVHPTLQVENQEAGFTSLGRYSLSAGVDRSLVRDLGHPDSYQLACGGEEKLAASPLFTLPKSVLPTVAADPLGAGLELTCFQADHSVQDVCREAICRRQQEKASRTLLGRRSRLECGLRIKKRTVHGERVSATKVTCKLLCAAPVRAPAALSTATTSLCFSSAVLWHLLYRAAKKFLDCKARRTRSSLRSSKPGHSETATAKIAVCLEIFTAFEAEKRGSDKGDIAMHMNCVTAVKLKALNWSARHSGMRTGRKRENLEKTPYITAVSTTLEPPGRKFPARRGPDIKPRTSEVLERPLTNRGAAVAERLDFSPLTKTNWVQSPAGLLPGFRKGESCRTIPLIGGLLGLLGRTAPELLSARETVCWAVQHHAHGELVSRQRSRATCKFPSRVRGGRHQLCTWPTRDIVFLLGGCVGPLEGTPGRVRTPDARWHIPHTPSLSGWLICQLPCLNRVAWILNYRAVHGKNAAKVATLVAFVVEVGILCQPRQKDRRVVPGEKLHEQRRVTGPLISGA